MAQAQLNHLLAHHLAQNDAVPSQVDHVLNSLNSLNIIAQVQQEEGSGGPLMHRWQLRLTSLIASSQAPPVRSAGFKLLHHTYASSITVLLSTGKAALSAAQSVLASPKTDSELFCAALQLVKLLLAKSTVHPEWARENVGAQAVQKLVGGLVQAASTDSSEVVHPCVSAITNLLPLYPTALRPLSPSLHTLAVHLIASPLSSNTIVDLGAELFCSLYALAPKGRDGLREAWKTGVEALVGSMDGLVSEVTTGIFAEDILYNHTLSPLSLPPFQAPAQLSSLQRLEALSRVLLHLLRTPTSEKAGPVSLPVGALVELSLRLCGLSTETPVKERVDPTTRTAVESILPRLQVIGCKLIAQLSLAVGPQLAIHASLILSTLSRTLGTYQPRSPMRPALSTTYSLVLASLGSSIDPEEGKKSLARVWRAVLEDVGGVALEPVVTSADAKEGSGNGRKAKRQRTYDPSESMAQRRVQIGEVEMDIAERGLATLERLLLAPFAIFLPPKLQLATTRLLLFLSLSPSFFLTHPLASTSTSFFPATSASNALDIAKQRARFRRGVVGALRSSIEAGVGAAGAEERAAEVWRRGMVDQDDEVAAISQSALLTLSRTIHPTLPPQQPNTSLSRQFHEAKGGFTGNEVDFRETAEEFRIKVIEARQEGDDEDDDEEEGLKLDAQEAARKAPGSASVPTIAPAPAPTFSTTPAATFAASPATNGFSSFAAPSFGSTSKPALVVGAVTPSALPTVAPTTPAPSAPAVEVEIVRSTTTTKTTTKVPVEASARTGGGGARDGEDSDEEDEAMPMIDMGSDEE
ncbi:hypothetical protein JCM11641_005089 [Rhodosporidiobolus odoratus]